MEISISALASSFKHKTIRIVGVIKWKNVSILFDSRNTHSFVDENLIKELNYTIDKTNTMTMSVANEDKLGSKAVCQPLVWRFLEWKFQFN